MSFQNNGPGVLNDIGALTDGETGRGSSLRIEQKRAHQFFMDTSEGELFSNKKQAVQSVSDTPMSAPASSNFSFWSNTSSYQSAPVLSTDRSCAPEARWTYNFLDKDVCSLGNENVTSERRFFISLPQNNSTVSLSMSHAGKDPGDLNAGTREVNMNLAGEFTSNYPFPLRKTSNTGEDSINVTTLGLTYGAGIENVFSMGYNSAYGKKPSSPIDNTSNKVNGECMIMSHQHIRGDINPCLTDQSLETGNNYDRTVNQTYQEYGSFMPIPSYKEAGAHSISLFPSYRKANEDFMPLGMSGNKDVGVASEIPTPSKVVEVESAEGSKKKVKKTPKSSSNNFPANVKSLLLTGILDGVPVKYFSWARDKSVRGIIQGYGYLCGCNDCKLSKTVSAFELESHAACKTRHPNNHIYFETGKSIFAVVQELKKTPPEMLFETIQNITGSPINQKNFQTWKASFQAANRELHHIYTKKY